MADRQEDLREKPRYDVCEMGMLWRSNGHGPERAGTAMITNVSIGGVQLRTRGQLDEGEEMVLELGSTDGSIYLPGDIRYASGDPKDGSVVFGFRFKPKNPADRECLAKFVLDLRDRIWAGA